MATDGAIARARRWLGYRGASSVIHQPLLLRRLAALAQQQPWLARATGTVVSRDDVVATFNRQSQFSSTAHRSNLIAGDFLIGSDSCPAQASHRRALGARLPSPDFIGDEAAAESRTRTFVLLGAKARRFDLVSDYMSPIVWQSLRSCFGSSLPMLGDNDPLFGHLRRIGAHLIVGATATDSVQTSARESAAALDAWVRERLPALQVAWGATDAEHREPLVRDAIGLLWVGHPATVQALALIVLEVLPRKHWQLLSATARGLHEKETDPWGNDGLRRQVSDHVLEALRFRPPFPILRREVVRNGHLGARQQSRIAGGAMVTLAVIGAMFDPAAHKLGKSVGSYCPGRQWVDEKDRYLMFGHGARQCIARDQVVQVLVSALIGLLLLPRLSFAEPWWRRFSLEGPAISRLYLKFRAG
jgi:cytochrome P450